MNKCLGVLVAGAMACGQPIPTPVDAGSTDLWHYVESQGALQMMFPIGASAFNARIAAGTFSAGVLAFDGAGAKASYTVTATNYSPDAGTLADGGTSTMMVPGDRVCIAHFTTVEEHAVAGFKKERRFYKKSIVDDDSCNRWVVGATTEYIYQTARLSADGTPELILSWPIKASEDEEPAAILTLGGTANPFRICPKNAHVQGPSGELDYCSNVYTCGSPASKVAMNLAPNMPLCTDSAWFNSFVDSSLWTTDK